MRKLAVLSIMLALMLVASLALAELPAPFEKIREYAQQSGKVEQGIYFTEHEGVMNGQNYSIVFIYNPILDIVGIGMIIEESGDPPTFVRWDGEHGVFQQLFFTPFGVAVEEIPESMAVEIAYGIMTHAVRLKLIKLEIVI